MEKEDVELWDWKRILIGDNPTYFLLEVFLRTIFIYIVLLIVMRLLGKKFGATNSILEMTVIISLGAIVSVPMQVSERGVLPGLVILLFLLFFYWLLSRINVLNPIAEHVSVGESSILVKDGIIKIDELKRAGISQEQLFTQLRQSEIKHLGEIKRVYLEACGIFSIYKEADPKPGLVVFPGEDQAVFLSIPRSPDYITCKNCGYTENSSFQGKRCPNCGVNSWDKASNENVTEKSKNYERVV